MPSPASERDVAFYNLFGTRLAGVLNAGDGDGSPVASRPAVVMCQGLSGVKRLVLPEVAAGLARRGIASLRFDYAGFGDSGGGRGWIDPRARVDDALYAFAWLAAQDGIDPDRIGVYGHSYGGPVGLVMASREQRVRAVVSVSGPGDGRTLLRASRTSWEWVAFKHAVEAERKQVAETGVATIVDVQAIFPFSPAFLAAYEELERSQGGSSAIAATGAGTDAGAGADPHDGELGVRRFALASVDAMLDFHPEDAARRLGVRPLLLVHGEDDDTAPIEDVDPVFARASGPKEWEIVPAAAHNDLDGGPGLERVIERAAGFFARHLSPADG